jgi:hypothetical protein
MFNLLNPLEGISGWEAKADGVVPLLQLVEATLLNQGELFTK